MRNNLYEQLIVPLLQWIECAQEDIHGSQTLVCIGSLHAGDLNDLVRRMSAVDTTPAEDDKLIRRLIRYRQITFGKACFTTYTAASSLFGKLTEANDADTIAASIRSRLEIDEVEESYAQCRPLIAIIKRLSDEIKAGLMLVDQQMWDLIGAYGRPALGWNRSQHHYWTSLSPDERRDQLRDRLQSATRHVGHVRARHEIEVEVLSILCQSMYMTALQVRHSIKPWFQTQMACARAIGQLVDSLHARSGVQAETT